jgi:tetratricopeptide (TPR) repeat protein
MITLIIALLTGGLLAGLVWIPVESWVLSAMLFVAGVIGVNFALGRHFMKKMTALMESVEKDLRSERMDVAIEKLKSGYSFSKWQFLVKKQIDSQIGSIYYIRKKFDEAIPYLKNSFSKNWGALAMLASHHYRGKEYAEAYKVMDSAISANKKEPFVYSLYAYFLSEQGQTDKAIEVLGAGLKKIPLSERLQSELDSVRNRKKIKMQNYGPQWMQLHLGKSQDGAKSYQMHLMNQRFKRR